jgi:regulator of RNase E activity RraA
MMKLGFFIFKFKLFKIATLSNTSKEKLQKVSTPNIAKCLFKSGLKNPFIQDVKPLQLRKPTMVVEAYTLRCIPARENRNPITVFIHVDHPQRVAVENCPPLSCFCN